MNYVIFLASILLLLRLWGTGYFVSVIRTQRILMQRPIDKDINQFRNYIHKLTILLTGSVIAPIAFDTFIILREVGIIDPNISTQAVMIFYAFSNALSYLLTSFLFYKMYDSALRIDEAHPKEADHSLMNNEDRGE